ncbi:MAG: hypothetical protein ACD_32C00152G0014 [uncultured bacterium]|uniref:Uncharacterized protein n=1 Tax=Candidatus Curtissbacteria bacterium GW2011_GWC2_38_9 TaxID=1618414 RepID=A0A0G0NVI7_9BACT|nr:MAG: hypothetical protein ACD_32C00152G0014 [uncultured bacterium]KKQ89899.1 MAG: hypothetical protein UT12_C0006G0007 [Candidatus Curtissbacteria bacterium GW2011_GWC2_38_9]OGE22430.1 MAG: hypothetical protein A2778_00020 [Candidatus Daviesbacteria bacterium RIFCSPHIGHO2_01_FULL_40_24]OGE43198.1 MAG: hypothetical protein A3A53_05830 [Candidatus Daviesbacteria bacterium RIFCSPLOWO2_01_FULL_39_23]OGE66076.1 MAG: hypothetical protein A3J16_00025 [Candidatus Daviesbacteria bacterium RIFCSPLOWO2
MKSGETKRSTFKRLATKRGNRIVKSINLLGNLSNKHNYSYTESDVKSIYDAIEEEVRLSKSRFLVGLNKGRRIKL